MSQPRFLVLDEPSLGIMPRTLLESDLVRRAHLGM
jgi:ABC-type branched-subunit amino acid transport system ATPase component